MDLERIRQLFLEEAQDLLDALDGALFELEERPADRELQLRFLRALHTLKGSSGTAGLPRLSELAHALEGYLDPVKQGRRTPDAEALDNAFEALEAVRAALAAVADGEGEPDALDRLSERLREISGAAQAVRDADLPADELGLGEYDWVRLSVLDKRGRRAWRLDLEFAPGVEAPAAHARGLLRRLRGLGEVLLTRPALTDLDSLEAGRRLVVLVGSERPVEELLAAVRGEAVPAPQARLFEDRRATPAARPEVSAEPALAPSTDPAVRVELRVLDGLLRRVGELTVDGGRLQRQAAELRRATGDDVLAAQLAEGARRLERIAAGLQDTVLRARRVPVDRLFRSIQRTIRSASRDRGREVRLAARGGTVEIDQIAVERLAGPLGALAASLARAAAGVGGFGFAAVEIAAETRGDDIEIRLGAPVPPDDPGAVATLAAAAEELGASLRLEEGDGFRGRLRLPGTLAVVPVMLAVAGEETYGLPVDAVEEILRVQTDALERVRGTPSLPYRGEALPVVFLAEAVGAGRPAVDRVSVLVVGWNGRRVGLAVERMLGRRAAIHQPLGPRFAQRREMAGATILDDGQVAILLHPGALLDGWARDGRAAGATAGRAEGEAHVR